MLRSATRAGLLMALLFVLPESANADVPPPDICDDVGSICTMNGTVGVCEESTCTRIDYASWNRESDESPPMASYACNRCIPGGEGSGPGSVLPAIGVTELGLLCCCGLTFLLLVLGGAFLAFRKKKE